MSKPSRKNRNPIQWPDADTGQAQRLRHAFALIATASDDRQITDEDRDRYRQLDALARKPAMWNTVPRSQFQLLVFQQILASAWDESVEPVLGMQELWKAATRRLTTSQRQELAAHVAITYSLFGNSFGRLFFPWGYCEEEPGVIAMAALEFAQYFVETQDDGPLITGPEALVTAATSGVVMHPGPVIAGVLMLGDRRNLPILDGSWRSLTSQDEQEFFRTNSGFTYAATIEYLLRWMEDVDDSRIGVPVAKLIDLRKTGYRDMVFDVERDLPISPRATDVVRHINQWSATDYAKVIEPRLLALLEREKQASDELVIPLVLRAWGIDWQPQTEDERQKFQKATQNANMLLGFLDTSRTSGKASRPNA